MKKIFNMMMAAAIAGFTFTSCEDVPEPYNNPYDAKPAPNVTIKDIASVDFIKDGQGAWAIADVNKPTEITGDIWAYDSQYGMKATAYANSTNYDAESWLIGPAFDLSESENTRITINHAANYFAEGAEKECFVMASDNYTSGDPSTATWETIKIDTWPTNWTYVDGTGSLAKFDGKKKVTIALKYTSTATKAGTWEIKTIKLQSVTGEEETPSEDEPTTDEAKAVTVADFIAAAESTTVWYKVTGTVKNLKDGDLYGNFDIEDETGSVYVYGLLSEKGGAKKKFQELVTAKGIKNGSKITIIGNRGSYNGTVQMANAYFVSIEEGSNSGDDTPTSDVKVVTIAEFNAATESTDVWYKLTGTISNLKDGDLYGNFDLTDATGSVYVYGVLSEKGGAKKLFQELVTKYGLTNGSTITIIGNRGSYTNKNTGETKIEVLNAYIVVDGNGDNNTPNTGTGADGSTIISVADFNAAAESTDVWYQLTGTISNLKDGDLYGNFDLTDATGSVYVYGVLSEKGGAKKLFQELVTAKGIANGKKITIVGNRGSYTNKNTGETKIEVMNAYFVSVE